MLFRSAAPAAGSEVVPSERARILVAYLLNSSAAYVYPEAKPLIRTPAQQEAKK